MSSLTSAPARSRLRTKGVVAHEGHFTVILGVVVGDYFGRAHEAETAKGTRDETPG